MRKRLYELIQGLPLCRREAALPAADDGDMRLETIQRGLQISS
jgi:hypothetical protein